MKTKRELYSINLLESTTERERKKLIKKCKGLINPKENYKDITHLKKELNSSTILYSLNDDVLIFYTKNLCKNMNNLNMIDLEFISELYLAWKSKLPRWDNELNNRLGKKVDKNINKLMKDIRFFKAFMKVLKSKNLVKTGVDISNGSFND